MFDMFHFLRPDWLWALVPLALLGWGLVRRRAQSATEGWARHVDRHLLAALAIAGPQARRKPWLPLAGAVMGLATVIGLAGPTWEQRQVPSFDTGAPMVAVLSLAQSMNADDLTPTRLKRAVHKLRDSLARTQGDQRGLVIYADRPFVAAPLTSDAQVIEQMLPELSTALMPVLGNRLDLAIPEAQAMLARAGAGRGRIIVIADDAGTDPAASVAAAQAAARAGSTVSVLGAGTEGGATVQTADRRAIAGGEGQKVQKAQTALAVDDLQAVAAAGGGRFARITAGDGDLEQVLPDEAAPATGESQEVAADGWVDRGYWLLILPAVLMPFAFRRGLVFGLGILAVALVQPQGARAGSWADLWSTPDQQGQAAFEAGDFSSAAGRFAAPPWQGAAAYRAGAYAQAAARFAGDDYNRGNALAKAGQLAQALAAYDAALASHPEDADAQFNRDLVAGLLAQQKQDQPQDQPSGGGGQQDRPSGGDGPQDQPQGGDDPQPGEDASQQGQAAAPSEGAAPPEPAEPASDPAAAQEQAADAETRRSAIGDMLSDLLGEGEPQEAVEGAAPDAAPIDQAIEQQLRRVPDDPSGLLRARIRQHYAKTRQGG